MSSSSKGWSGVYLYPRSLACTIMFLVVAYTQIKPQKESMPCGGKCEGCVADPDCQQWVRKVEAKHPATAVCPPAISSADTDATFSCLADGYWMLVTSVISLVWLTAAGCILRNTQDLVEAGSDEPASGTSPSTVALDDHDYGVGASNPGASL